MKPNEPSWEGAEGLAFRLPLFAYEGAASHAVRRLKYERITSLAAPMSRLMAERAAELGLFEDAEAVPVPLHWTRWCQRGFNQAELLARELPVASLSALIRVKATRPQAGLSAQERRRDLENVFQAKPGVAGKRLVLIDDVLTTGQTAQACAKTLLNSGALEVGVLTFAGNP
jgi:ComF family protein